MPIQSRLELQAKLEALIGDPDRVWFQPPSEDQLKYPCLIYTVKDGEGWHANNHPYAFFPFYDVTYIYKDPDEGAAFVKKLMMAFPGIRYDRAWRVDNLYHDNMVVW